MEQSNPSIEKVFGCGIDIEELSRFDRHTDIKDYSLIKELCSSREIQNLHRNKRVRLALSFACKEAFFKAFGMSWTNSRICWTDIELLFHDDGIENYTIELNNYANELLAINNLRIGEAILDCNDDTVMFQVVLLTKPDTAKRTTYN